MVEIVSEVGWNHTGDLDLAEKMIKASKESGADIAKFQAWSEKRLKPGPWDHDGRREIYKKAELDAGKHQTLLSMCKDHDIKYMSSVFSIEDAKLVSQVTRERVKIPSTESHNLDLIEFAINTFDRIYISVGTLDQGEILALRSKIIGHEKKCVIMHCTSSYPCPEEDVNMTRLLWLQSMFHEFECGYSGHHKTHWDAILAISMGASVIEKHFTIDRDLPGRDNKMALLPEDLKQIREYATLREKMTNSFTESFRSCEEEARDKYRGRWDG